MGRITPTSKPKRVTRSPLSEHIGSRLLELRQKHQVSVHKLAEEIELAASTVSTIENGVNVPTVDTLWRMAKFFKVKLDWFVQGFEE